MQAQYLRTLGLFERVGCIDINLRGTDQYKRDVQVLIDDLDTMAITHPLSDQFGPIATEELRSSGRPVLSTTNFYFAGLHPDAIYLGGFQGRVISPLGDYHSKIIVASYLQGASVAECIRRFNGETYENAGYFSVFKQSADELLNRDSQIDVKSAEIFIERLRVAPTMMTVNHPVVDVIALQAAAIIQALNLSATPFPPSYMVNTLSESAWLPIYPEVREALRIEYETPMNFKRPNQLVPLSLGEYVAGSFDLYAQQHDTLLKAAQIDDLRATFAFMA